MERPTASEAMKDPWIDKYCNIEEEEKNEEILINVLKNLKAFNTQMTFQKAVLSYVASQLLTKEEEERLKASFNYMNTNNNGIITLDELISSYKLLDKNEKMAKVSSKSVMNKIDLNQNGVIDYNEFLMANLITEDALTKERLKKVFEFFDIVLIIITYRIKMDI